MEKVIANTYNYQFITWTLVLGSFQILISKQRAVGVEYVRNGQKRTVGANTEVILTAGVVGTPHVLLLSGIGPKDMIEELGVHSNTVVESL